MKWQSPYDRHNNTWNLPLSRWMTTWKQQQTKVFIFCPTLLRPRPISKTRFVLLVRQLQSVMCVNKARVCMTVI